MFSIYVQDKNLYENFYKAIKDKNISSGFNKTNKTIKYLVKYPNLIITFYTNQRILFNGVIPDSMEIEFRKLIDSNLYVGSDEVGTGEQIGPLIVCGVQFKDYEAKIEVAQMGIRDSKKLSFDKIIELKEKIEPYINFATVILEPIKLNVMMNSEEYNMKKINAFLHNKVHNKFINQNSTHVIDQFVNRKKYFEYLENQEINYKKIIFEEKADDKFLEVSVASIFAKEAYNKWIIKFLAKEGITFNIKNRLNTNLIYQKIIKGEYKITDKKTLFKSWNL